MTIFSPGRSVPLILAAATVLAVTPPAVAGAATAAGAVSRAGADAGATITLITGDEVTVRAGVTTVRGPAGEQVGAHITTIGPDTYVYPESALPYVGTGRLDKRLFNITLLLREGYGDGSADRLPVILGYSGTAAKRADALPEAATEVRALPSIHGRAVSTDRDRAEDFWASLTGAAPASEPAFTRGITKVWLDGKVHADLAGSVAQIGAPEVWAGGNDGEGVDVAVLDTGIDAEHPDLAGRVGSSVSFVPGEDVTDRNGHGTHVASTIAGTGAGSDGAERGVAPGADLQIGKVLDNGGSGEESWIIAGMEWAARERRAKVVSMSLGGDPTDGTDPMSAAVNQLSAETGALFASASAYLGLHPLEDAPSGTTEKQITYTNTGTADVALELSLTAPGVPTGVVALSSPGVTVPAGGTASVTVSANLDLVPSAGRWTGSVVATGADGTRVADTLVGLSTENPPKRLTIKPTGRSGEPMPGDINLIREGDPAGTFYNLVSLDGSPVDVILPEGRYSVWMWGEVEGSHGPSSRGVALVSEPTLVIDGNTTLELKASATREIQAVTPRTSATAELRLDFHRELGGTASATDSFLIPRYYDSMWTVPGQKAAEGRLSVTARWRKIQPTLSLGAAYDDLLVLPGSTLPAEGTRQLPAVLVDDFATADLTNKIAVVRQGDLDEQVDAAEKAGAALLLIVAGGTGRWYEATARTPLAVASLTRDGGEALIARLAKGRVSLTVTSHPATDYLYDLVSHWPDGTPKSLVYRPSERELARVDVDFQSTSDRELEERRYDYNRDMPVKVGTTLPMLADRYRTDWVTARADVSWSQEMNDRQSYQRGGSTTYRAGGTYREKWLAAIQRPRINDAGTLPHRDGDRIVVEVPGWGDSGGDHASDVVPSGGGQTVTLSQGGTVLEHNTWGWADSATGLSPAKLPYRLSTTTTGDPAVHPYSIRTSTDWDFTSDAATVRLPPIQLDYDVDTDLAHRASRTAGITVVPSHLAGAPSSRSITSVTLAVSYDDGATWVGQRLSRTQAGWTTELRAPRSAQHVTLRTTAKDAYGNRVQQTITRAFGLR